LPTWWLFLIIYWFSFVVYANLVALPVETLLLFMINRRLLLASLSCFFSSMCFEWSTSRYFFFFELIYGARKLDDSEIIYDFAVVFICSYCSFSFKIYFFCFYDFCEFWRWMYYLSSASSNFNIDIYWPWEAIAYWN